MIEIPNYILSIVLVATVILFIYYIYKNKDKPEYVEPAQSNYYLFGDNDED